MQWKPCEKERILFMKKFVVFLFLLLFAGNLKFAEAANNQETVAVTVSAEVPAGWGGEVSLTYQMADGSGPEYLFKLNSDNGYILKQTVLKGNYKCIGMEASQCKLIVEKNVRFTKGTAITIIVHPNNSLDNLSEVSAETINFIPSTDSNSWIFVVAAFGVALMSVVVIFIKTNK